MRIAFLFLVDIPILPSSLHVGHQNRAGEGAAREHGPAAREPAGLRPRRQCVVLVHRRGCRRLPCPETGQDRGSAKRIARTMPGRPRPICRSRDARKERVKINAPGADRGPRKGSACPVGFRAQCHPIRSFLASDRMTSVTSLLQSAAATMSAPRSRIENHQLRGQLPQQEIEEAHMLPHEHGA